MELPRPGRPERARLFPDQAEAVERLVRHLRRAGTRGLFVSATGTGKTLVSIRTADELGARLVLFVVPTRDLAAQTALAWRRDGHLEHLVIVVCLVHDREVERRDRVSRALGLFDLVQGVVGADHRQRGDLVLALAHHRHQSAQGVGAGARHDAGGDQVVAAAGVQGGGSPAGPTRSGPSSTTPSVSAPTAAST
ncbi:DEAD/DEAH box helicase family protein [Streptomyces bottropensis]|uniref:DEAD/DEAH box helicase family protein n=1 Tax=Streptomyces bottropensis TaxID=42235 RepID=UPI0036A1D8B3